VVRPLIPTVLYLSAGLLIWAANFLVTYIFTAMVCARRIAGVSIGETTLAVVILVSTALAIAAATWILLKASARIRAQSGRNGGGFIDFVAAAVAGLSIIALVWTGFVAAVSGQCISS
jgi:hypothetical protein